VDKLIAGKKTLRRREKARAVTFVRGEQEGLQKSAWALHLKISSLAEWDKLFDRAMTPLTMPEKRGQTGKVTVESVSRIVFLARRCKTRVSVCG